MASERLTPRVQALRETFKKAVARVPIDRLIFLDESGCNRAMATRHAWSPAGQRAVADRPINHGKNITMVGAMRLSGPVVLRSAQGAMNTVRFERWLRKDLAPRLSRGDVVVMDNLRAHHGRNVASILKKRGAKVLYLPPYSPDLNPIEYLWSIVKHKLRKSARRQVAILRRTIAGIWSQLRRRDLFKLFVACGYA